MNGSFMSFIQHYYTKIQYMHECVYMQYSCILHYLYFFSNGSRIISLTNIPSVRNYPIAK